jgi:hypothetical protein
MSTQPRQKAATTVVEQLLAGHSDQAAMQQQLSELEDAAAAMIYDAEQQLEKISRKLFPHQPATHKRLSRKS